MPLAVPFRTPPVPLMFTPPLGGLMTQPPAPAPLPVACITATKSLRDRTASAPCVALIVSQSAPSLARPESCALMM